MKKAAPFLAAILLSSLATAHAVSVTPIVNPHMTFVDGSGNPCDGCKLYTYAAGTSTPLATYTDSTGIPTNTNPIVLDASGGPATPSGSTGGIWLGRNSYKFILKSAAGATIWTADNVNAGSLLPCAPANTIQIANSAVNGLSCDSSITINTVTHTLNIGTLSANHVTIGAVGTPTSWTFDTTSPATALASLGGGTGGVNAGTLNQLGYYATAGSQISGTSAIPNGITATTQTASDNSTKVATTGYVAAPGIIAPTSVALAGGTAMTGNQGTGTKVQHSTGSTTTNNCAKFDASGNVVDAGTACPAVAPISIVAQVTFTSCTLGDDGTGGSGCQTSQAWGSTIAGSYTMWCNVGYEPTVGCGNLGDCSGIIVNEETHSSTDFTYILNQRLSNGRTHTVSMNCYAAQ